MSDKRGVGGSSVGRSAHDSYKVGTNLVHWDENWRGRLKSERVAAAQWTEGWGFLQHSQPQGSFYVDKHMPNRVLTKTITKMGPMFPLLKDTYRQREEEKDQFLQNNPQFISQIATQHPSGSQTYRGSYAPSSPFASSPTSASSSSSPFASSPTSLSHPAGFVPRHLNGTSFYPADNRQTPQSSQQNSVNPAPPTQPQTARVPRPPATSRVHNSNSVKSNNPHIFQPTSMASVAVQTGSQIMGSLQATSAKQAEEKEEQDSKKRPTTPPLYLNTNDAYYLQPHYWQDVGMAVKVDGVDPNRKYRHPQLSSHAIGWDVTRGNLEFFGVSQHPTRTLNNKTLYGYEIDSYEG